LVSGQALPPPLRLIRGNSHRDQALRITVRPRQVKLRRVGPPQAEGGEQFLELTGGIAAHLLMTDQPPLWMSFGTGPQNREK
jgi:hypothetical protein